MWKVKEGKTLTMNYFIKFYENKNQFFTTLGLLILFLPFVKTCSSKTKHSIEIIAKTSIDKPIDSLNFDIYKRDTINDSIYYYKEYQIKKERKLKLWDDTYNSGYKLSFLFTKMSYSIFNYFWKNEEKDSTFDEFLLLTTSFFFIFISAILYFVGFFQTIKFPEKQYFTKYLIIEVSLFLFFILMTYLIKSEKSLYVKILYGFWIFLINNSILVYYNYKAYKKLKQN